MKGRFESIDIVRGLVMVLMALDHVRMYFGYGTWYADPTDLSTTTSALFLTRWITHFCAPAFVFLAGVSAYLSGLRWGDKVVLARYLLLRGLWLVLLELVVINLAWTFDVRYSFIILQVIWAIGLSMVFLAALVFLPFKIVTGVGLLLVAGHNLLDGFHITDGSVAEMTWHVLHQPGALQFGGRLVNVVYPVLPWAGLMALGYVAGKLYDPDEAPEKRRRWLLSSGAMALVLFLALRALNLYGEPIPWREQASASFTVLSFLNTTKYPPSLQFLLMTMGPLLIFLAFSERVSGRAFNAVGAFGRVPLFFYVVHLYFIHGLATLGLMVAGRDWAETILSAAGLRSGVLANFGYSLLWVYAVWIGVLIGTYPLCVFWHRFRETNRAQWWVRFV